jgi:F0F1-type ATP synthase membrane subunit c/vacuolar-type H+-ATPase subunit K
MTRRIALFVGIAFVALAVAAPALGEGMLAGSIGQQDTVTQVSRPDSHDIVRTQETTYLDAADRARRIDVVVPTALTDSFERAAPPQGTVSTLTISSSPDSGIEWPGLGLGFGLGMLLAAGLWLATRTPRRPLAH